MSTFCRRCGVVLPTSWYSDQTAAGLASDENQTLSIAPAVEVYSFAEFLPPSVQVEGAIELEPIGGWLGVGLPGGQIVLLDAIDCKPRVHRRDFCWPVDPGDRTALGTWSMVACEQWLVAYLRDRLRVVNLLSGETGGAFPTVLTWRSPEGVQLLAPPVLVPQPVEEGPQAKPAGAILAWVAGPLEGEPSLYLADITAVGGEQPVPRAASFGALKLAGPYAGAALIAVPGAKPGLLVAGGSSLVLLTAQTPGRMNAVAWAHDLPALSLRNVDRPLGGIPTLGFLPYPSADPAALGLAALSCNDGQDLLLVPVGTGGMGVGRQLLPGVGHLLGTARHDGEEVFLTFDRWRLKVVNRLHATRSVRDLSGAHQIQWARVVGRLFAYTASRSPLGYCAGVIDLETGVALNLHEDTRHESPRPVVAGRDVFTVEWRKVTRKSDLLLFRQPLQYTDLPMAIE